MELIDRYLQAVKFALPKGSPDDIIQELNDSVLSQVEEKEAALGRPLTEDEVVELLRKMGSPDKLASRYREQQGLIGPTVMPIYWKVLKAALGLVFLVEVIAAIVTAAAGRSLLASLAPILNYPSAAFTTFAWVTLTFVALHYFGAKFQSPEQWDPRKLPALVKTKRGKSRTELIAALVIGAIATVWWLVGLRNPFLIMGPGVMFLTFAPVWLKLYPVWVALGIAEIARHAFEFAKPYASRQHLLFGLVPRCLSLIAMFFLIRAQALFVVNPNNPALQPAIGAINYGTRLGLTIAAVIALAKLLYDIWKLMAERFEQAHQAAVRS
ncbi:MAG: hypothetical protein WBS19_04810 [Candidatus Korobacteraceae bacterium]